MHLANLNESEFFSCGFFEDNDIKQFVSNFSNTSEKQDFGVFWNVIYCNKPESIVLRHLVVRGWIKYHNKTKRQESLLMMI